MSRVMRVDYVRIAHETSRTMYDVHCTSYMRRELERNLYAHYKDNP